MSLEIKDIITLKLKLLPFFSLIEIPFFNFFRSQQKFKYYAVTIFIFLYENISTQNILCRLYLMFAGKLSIVKYIADILNFVLLLPKVLHISNSSI